MVLRGFVFLIGIVCLFGGIVGLVLGHFPPAFMFFAWGAVIVIGVVFERFRYKRLALRTPGPGWEKTSERFIDDETGKTVTVYMKPATGERQYVED